MCVAFAMSDNISDLAKALSKCQGELSAAMKSGKNPFFKNSSYATYNDIWGAVQEPLTKNNLAVSQFPLEGGVLSILMHESGQWIRGFLKLKPVKDDPQSHGSAITYARRYALQAILGLPAEDDDGNAASGLNAPKKGPNTNAKAQNFEDDTKHSFLPMTDSELYEATPEQLEKFKQFLVNKFGVRDITKQLRYSNVLLGTPRERMEDAVKKIIQAGKM